VGEVVAAHPVFAFDMAITGSTADRRRIWRLMAERLKRVSTARASNSARDHGTFRVYIGS
jgi:acyl-CoA reductase-like NAD-dependent aldehyde dehydrogenase